MLLICSNSKKGLKWIKVVQWAHTILRCRESLHFRTWCTNNNYSTLADKKTRKTLSYEKMGGTFGNVLSFWFDLYQMLQLSAKNWRIWRFSFWVLDFKAFKRTNSAWYKIIVYNYCILHVLFLIFFKIKRWFLHLLIVVGGKNVKFRSWELILFRLTNVVEYV